MVFGSGAVLFGRIMEENRDEIQIFVAEDLSLGYLKSDMNTTST